jgi:hypothetical protein
MIRFFNYNLKNQVDSIFTEFRVGMKYLSELNIYNEKDQLIECYNCFEKRDCELKTRNTYNEFGFLIKKVGFIRNSENGQHSFEYDKFGNNIRMITELKSGMTLKRDNLFTPDNVLYKTIFSSSDGVKSDSIMYEYTKAGQLSLMLEGSSTTEYLYDDLGNNIEYRLRSSNDQLIDLRKMEYDGLLMKSRIHYKGKKIHKHFIFEYERYPDR